MRRAAFDSLLAEVRACSLCQASLPAGPRPVLQASPGARILIAAQAPGRRVHASGIPFDDASGERLRDWTGLSRAAFYDPELVAILPMGFCYPGAGRSGDLPPRAECAPAWRERLLGALPQVELTLVIGAHAQAWHMPRQASSVTDAVRRWRVFWPSQLPLPHPSPRNNGWLAHNPWFEAEVVPALRQRIAALCGAHRSASRR
ncbi:uracil-DNA glycosylase family protein [Piscinibacter sakaiensis]|uniref:uracil-DNA glycosylase family protein n=1 Tax=Piscinibacter sakaiensis TaxID=1547922 RepID=UPI003AB0C12D